MTAEFIPSPIDNDWWINFAKYTENQIEGSVNCKRVHPKIANWLNDKLANIPFLSFEFGQKVVSIYETNKYIIEETTEDEDKDKEYKIFLMLGRSLKSGYHPKTDIKEIRQAMACLAVETLNSCLEDMENLDELGLDGIRLLNFASAICGEENASAPIGTIIMGYLFETSLQNGELDDL